MSSWPPGFNHDWAQRRWRGNEWKDKSINVASSQRYKFKDGVRRCSHGSVWKGPACRLCAGLCLCCRPHRRILLGTSSLWHQPPQTGPEAENTLLIVFFYLLSICGIQTNSTFGHTDGSFSEIALSMAMFTMFSDRSRPSTSTPKDWNVTSP